MVDSHGSPPKKCEPAAMADGNARPTAAPATSAIAGDLRSKHATAAPANSATCGQPRNHGLFGKFGGRVKRYNAIAIAVIENAIPAVRPSLNRNRTTNAS